MPIGFLCVCVSDPVTKRTADALFKKAGGYGFLMLHDATVPNEAMHQRGKPGLINLVMLFHLKPMSSENNTCGFLCICG